MTIYLVCEDGYPSFAHSRYLVKEEAQKEVDRLAAADKAHNDRIDASPATGRGSAFLNMKRRKVWSVQERIINHVQDS